MRLSAFIEATGVEIISVPNPAAELTAGYTSDLLSDVIAHCPEDSVLITVQNHKNTVAVCTLVGAVAILVTHQRDIPADMLEAATAEQVAVLRTPLDQFHATCTVANVLNNR
jgi:predicted transcriptional regulator